MNEPSSTVDARQQNAQSLLRWPPASTAAAWMFGLCLLVCLLAAGSAGLFFVIGLIDGSVSFGNADDWAIALLVCFGIPVAGLALRLRGQTWLASAVLALLALPTLLVGFAILVFIVSGGRWQ